MTSDGKTTDASSAGRGVLLLAASNIFFIFAGMAIQFGLPAVLTVSVFGAYTLVNSIASLFNNVLVTGTIQTVSRSSAQTPEVARAFQHAGLRMHLRLGLVLAIGFIASAPLIAWFLHDDSKTAPLMLAGLIVGGYSFYAVFVGTANGLKRFDQQAGLTVVFAAVRAAALIGMAVAGATVVGLIGGWVAAVALILVLAVLWVGLPGRISPDDKKPIAPLVRYFARVGGYLIFFNAILFVDNFLLKRILSESLAHAGASDEVVSKLTDEQVGYYGAVQNLARLSYQVLIAATFVAFPLISRSTFMDDKETTRRYVEVTARYSLIAGAAMAVVLAANPGDVLGLVYAPDFVANGADALPYLALGTIGYTMIAIAGTILNSAGKTTIATVLAAGTMVVSVVANYVGISLAADSGHVLQITAACSGGAMLLGAIACGIVLRKEFGAFVPVLTLVRVLVALAVAIAVGRFLPLHGKVMTLAEAIVVAVVFVVAIVAMREISSADIARLKSIRRKPKA